MKWSVLFHYFYLYIVLDAILYNSQIINFGIDKLELTCYNKFNDMSIFIKNVMDKRFDTAVLIRLKNVKTSAAVHEFVFDVICSNGSFAQGVAAFKEFACSIEITCGKNSVVRNYDREWAHHVYSILKERESAGFTQCKISESYKADYNENNMIKNRGLSASNFLNLI